MKSKYTLTEESEFRTKHIGDLNAVHKGTAEKQFLSTRFKENCTFLSSIFYKHALFGPMNKISYVQNLVNAV